MTVNTTIVVPAATWTLLTAADVNLITFQNVGNNDVFVKATTDTNAPTNTDGAYTYKPGLGEIGVFLTDMFPGIVGADRVWAYSVGGTSVVVSYGAIVAGSFYLDRGNHTGTQLSSTISDFINAVETLIEWDQVSGQGWYGLPTYTDRGSGYTDGAYQISLSVASGTAPLVEVIIENGKVWRVRWLSAGANLTAAPTFPWGSLTGAGTPGNITFSLADGGVYRRTATNQVEARREYLRDGFIRPEWYGALGNNTGNDAVAINLCFDFVRCYENSASQVNPTIKFRSGSRYVTTSPINAAGFRSQRFTVDQCDARIKTNFVGVMAIDLTYTRNIVWPIYLYGDAVNRCDYAVVLQDRGEDSSAWNNLEGSRITGFFNEGIIYNGGSELPNWENCHFLNSHSGGHSLVIDCENAESPGSPFEVLTETTATWEPLSQVNISANSRVSSIDADAIKIIGYAPMFTMDQVYAAVFNGSIVGLHNPASTLDIDAMTSFKMRVRGEPRTHGSGKLIKSAIKFYNPMTIRGLEFEDYGADYTVAILENASGGVVTIDDIDLTAHSITDGGFKPAHGGNINVRGGRMALTGTQANVDDLSGFGDLRLSEFQSRYAKAAITWPSTYGVWLHPAGGNPQFVTNTQATMTEIEGGLVVGRGALATNATTGFLYIPTCAGAPTGVPITYTGLAPLIIDTTNNKLYFRSGGVWRDAGP